MPLPQKLKETVEVVSAVPQVAEQCVAHLVDAPAPHTLKEKGEVLSSVLHGQIPERTCEHCGTACRTFCCRQTSETVCVRVQEHACGFLALSGWCRRSRPPLSGAAFPLSSFGWCCFPPFSVVPLPSLLPLGGVAFSPVPYTHHHTPPHTRQQHHTTTPTTHITHITQIKHITHITHITPTPPTHPHTHVPHCSCRAFRRTCCGCVCTSVF